MKMPCACRGTIGSVHEDCLAELKRRYRTCRTCGEVLDPTAGPSLLGKVIVTLVFLVNILALGTTIYLAESGGMRAGEVPWAPPPSEQCHRGEVLADYKVDSLGRTYAGRCIQVSDPRLLVAGQGITMTVKSDSVLIETPQNHAPYTVDNNVWVGTASNVERARLLTIEEDPSSVRLLKIDTGGFLLTIEDSPTRK